MYLLSQMAAYLLIAFVAGVGAGYALWRTWGERESVAKFNAAELRLAEYIAQWEAATSMPAAGSSRERLHILRGGADAEATNAGDLERINRR